MALTELKQPTKVDFYATMKNAMSTLRNTMFQLERLSEDLALMDAATLDSMGLPASGSDNGLRSALADARTMCNEMIGFFNGSSTTQTAVPKTIVNKLRSM